MTSVEIYLAVTVVLVVVTAVFAIRVSRVVVNEERTKLSSDISVETMQELEDNVANFLKTNDMAPGAPIHAIAKKLNIKEGPTDTKQEEQAFLREQEQGPNVVTFKKNLTPEERRFAFAHECAHLVNKDTLPVTRPDSRNKPMVEQLADYTAAALLMPADTVYDYIEEHNFKLASPRKRMAIVRKLCKIYHVSDVIAIRRIHEVYALKAYKK